LFDGACVSTVGSKKGASVLDAVTQFDTAGDLGDLFVEVLGWGRPEEASIELKTATGPIVVSPVADLSGFLICEVKCETRPSGSVQRAIDKEIGLLRADRLVVFTYPTGQTWRWPKMTASNSMSQEVLDVRSGQVPLFLAQRLAGLAVTAKELLSGVSLVDIRSRVRGQFDSSTVTKKFYDQFKGRHEELSNEIKGIADTADRRSYSTLILNRLMFLYFLQKKGFLNGDLDYLRNCLREVRELSGEGKFYEFYRDCLLPMCFDGLNKKGGIVTDPDMRRIVGRVPYVNGGLFEEHAIESSSSISIPDSAFEEIFEFFDRFVWHLDTRLTGNPNEINPDVLGYIFEQYINFTSKGRKDNGAYYTKEDITGYMVDSTLAVRILEVIQSAGVDVLERIRSNPSTYLRRPLLHGRDSEGSAWLPAPANLEQCWKSDPENWGELDTTPTDDAVCLPGETWVEAFHRRERIEEILQSTKSISDLNMVITLDLDVRLLIRDCLEHVTSVERVLQIWQGLSSIAVLDPTCGSGAFLFAALELLEEVYVLLIEGMESSDHDENVDVKTILSNIKKHANTRYFVRKHSALHNLYGTDIMEDAIETAKLRIFLSLVACIDHIDELEPLPDLDFNLRCGNLLVGFIDADDANRVGGNIFVFEELGNLQPEIDRYLQSYREFIDKSADGSADLGVDKTALRETAEDLRSRANNIYATCLRVSGSKKIAAWVKKSKPLHWFLEFPGVIANGGFDVVIGNPPYIAKSKINDYDIIGFKTDACPDIYAQCYERSLNLLRDDGRHAFIVMVSLAFGADFGALRKFISDRNGAEWWSTYGKRPSSLFEGAEVVNTILVLAKGEGSYSTSHHIFTAETRSWLFSALEYHPISRVGTEIPLRGGIANAVVKRMALTQGISAPKSAKKHLYVKNSGRYWFPMMFKNTPSFDKAFGILEDPDPNTKVVPLGDSEDWAIATVVCGGKLGYLWWSSTGDDLNTGGRHTMGPRSLVLEHGANESLKELAEGVYRASPGAAFATRNAGKLFLNLRWSQLRTQTDPFDRQVLAIHGLEGEWRNLNIWYRMTMRSSGENNNSVVIPDEIVKKYF